MTVRQQPNPMRLRLAELPTARQIALSNEFVRAALEGDPMRDALERPADDPRAGEGEADLQFYAEGHNVFARGRLRGWFEVACGRCVATVRVALDEDITATFMPREQVPDLDEPAEEEVELAEEDLDLYPYEGDEVDLEPLLREHLILSVPYAPLCDEACRGLCPQCGIDLNLSACRCEAPIDPRLAALKNIKL